MSAHGASEAGRGMQPWSPTGRARGTLTNAPDGDDIPSTRRSDTTMRFTARGRGPMTGLRWLAVAVLYGWLAFGVMKQTAASVELASSSHREVLFTYLVSLPRIPQEAQKIYVWIPLAKTRSEQEILRREVRTSIPYTIAEDPEYGNDILHLSLKPPFPERLEVKVDYHVQLRGDDVASTNSPPTPAELTRYRQARGLVIIDEEVRTRARHATAGRPTLLERARGIYDSVRQSVAYDKSVPGWGQGDTRRVCLLGKGNCTDFHSLLISMGRAEGIPTRFKIGVVIPNGSSATIPGYHCWAEFYVDEQGWVPVDASEAWKHPELADYYFGARDPSRFLMSVGRDIQLVPKQQGDPVNIFFYPYVEIDGVEFLGVETELRFQELKQEGVV